MNNTGNVYETIISLKNLYEAWREFVVDKKKRIDVAEFMLDLNRNIYNLHQDLKSKSYRHGAYQAFSINDPKPRSIHKATVRDRLLHHAICRVLDPYFDKRFIYDSYSSRDYKGTHRAVNRFRDFYRRVSSHSRRTCWVLKCDIRKFFASVDHKILMEIVKKHIPDVEVVTLIQEVVFSFHGPVHGVGMPLGNVTSQLLVNVYMNEFDQYLKHWLKVKYYTRYADDFVIMNRDRNYLVELLPKIRSFLESNLRLNLHPDKVFIKSFASGVDFLGWINFAKHRVLRTSTKRRMFKRLAVSDGKPEVINSYLGLIKHGNTHLLKEKVEKYKRQDDKGTPGS